MSHFWPLDFVDSIGLQRAEVKLLCSPCPSAWWKDGFARLFVDGIVQTAHRVRGYGAARWKDDEEKARECNAIEHQNSNGHIPRSRVHVLVVAVVSAVCVCVSSFC